ncbi:MAG TPA: OmpH family outer membrane protein [Deltaproteobacteria bacterium]|nr:OmpH family outer membrane protein [Deltaproteobacteria bacterium]
MLIPLTSVALAQPVEGEPVGHYHPDDIAPRSELFVTASEQLSALSDTRGRELQQLATALQHYREALDLLGDTAPLGELERLGDLEQDFHRQEAVLQQFTDELIEDFSGAMVEAMEQAAASHGQTQRCVARIAEGPRVPGMPGRTKANPECLGEDLNAAIASAMDANEPLRAVVEEVLQRPWPEIVISVEAQPPIATGSGQPSRWLLVRDLLVAGARDALRDLDRSDDEARTEIEAALESDDPDLEALKRRVAEIEATTARRRAELAQPILEVAEERMLRWKGEPTTGWCANPRILGGCTQQDASAELVSRLLDDRKFAKTLPD